MVSSSHLVALLALACGAQAAPAWVVPFWNPFAMQAKSYSFSTYTGFFKYDTQEGTSLAAVAPNFGLRDNVTWDGLARTLLQLNIDGAAHDGSSYKLVFAGRHGQGYHNVAESKYGTALWDSYWSELTTDGNLTWGPDARLTPLGIQQAQAVHDGWVAVLKQRDSAPLPTKLYSSPLSRALSTMEISYDHILLNNPNATIETPAAGNTIDSILGGILGKLGEARYVKPEIKELFREEYGEHTCDQRRTRSQIARDYPNVRFEAGFSEEDQLWTTTREQDAHLDARIQQALTQVWNEAQQDQVISLTSHSGVMQSLFRVTHHYPIKPSTGALIPLIIKATPQK
ncbi:phosphoglycerate mutase [Moesziomyces antarcticus]|uniref:Related to PMU1 - putative phosphomutase n=1 Tax=Pseudozyma antarctica TaxID=84753 RepID=A0A5C3FLN8_PSEA2|nr:phosphoglycerate mutase [Moesziomyces antarcticus]GAK63766.1 phosphoglycerate mutase [Moesziomyces antarcticus]SPO44369.1 related to PMU1 - putative phosphomutase [Moesziomyces antarcticus]